MARACIACGMPMQKEADYPMEDCNRNYCKFCARPDGSMQSFYEKKQGLAEFLIQTQGLDQEAAIELAEQNMRRLPAWEGCF